MHILLEIVGGIAAVIILVAVIVTNADYDEDDYECDPEECLTCPFPCDHRDQL